MNNILLRKQLFLAVRNIPYRINSDDKDASCVAKAKLLGELLTRIGLKCRVMKGVVQWKDTGIPKSLLKLTRRPIFYHFFLQVYVPESGLWVNVDPTWDPSLKSNLRVNIWNGLNDTVIAYQIKKLQIVGSPFDFNYRDFNPTDLFTKLLNSWYESQRKE